MQRLAEPARVSLLEDHTASFIVRIWRERGEGPVTCQEWRGSIEHVQSGGRSFFRDLSAIPNFMKPHLEQLGIEAPLRFWHVMTPELFAGDDAVPRPEPVAPTGPARPPRRKR
jgi:hypothetical protein